MYSNVCILYNIKYINRFRILFFQMEVKSSLFVNIVDLDEVNKHVICSLQTSIVLFVCQYINTPVILVKSKKIKDKYNHYKFSIKDLHCKIILENDVPRPAADCLLPVFQSDNGYYCTAGFCSSLRMVRVNYINIC